MKRFNNRKMLGSKNKVVIKQVINFPSKPEMKKLVKAAVDDRTKQMINEAKKRFADLEKDFAREKRAMEEAARFVEQSIEENFIYLTLGRFQAQKARFLLIERNSRCMRKTLTVQRNNLECSTMI